nr:MAG TPA: hypothetical protein [Caudoviricetes sp.]
MKVNNLYRSQLRMNKRFFSLLNKYEKFVNISLILLSIYAIYYVYMYA